MAELLGVYETSVLDDGRIRLPIAVTQQLENAGARTVRAGILPGQKALVLFPQETWPTGIQKLLQQNPVLASPEGFRSFLSLSVPLSWQDQGRISLPDRLLHDADLRIGQLVVIVGVGDHFEIWNSDAYEEMRRRCQEALGSRPSPKEPSSPDGPFRKKDRPHGKPEQENLS
jgi:MraZ protein